MRTPDRDFLERFERASLSPAEWDHRAHLRMAYLQLVRHGWPGAIRPVRDGIQRLNRSHGGLDGEHCGYHETLTLCWLRLLADRLARGGPYADSRDFLRQHPELLERDRVLRHYSRDRLADARARREFVLPDRAPLPTLAASASVRNGSAPGKDPGAGNSDPELAFGAPLYGDPAAHDDPIGSRRNST